MIKNRIILILLIIFILIIAGLSTWRFVAIFGPQTIQPKGLFGLLMFAFILFWSGVVYLLFRFAKKMTRQQWLTVIIGTIFFAFIGLLLTTPTGFSRATISIVADNVWSPTLFTAEWTEGNLRQAIPLSLPTGNAVPTTLEIITTPENSGQVWLLNVIRSDGSIIPLNEFEADNSWELREVNWQAYENRPVWVSPPGEQQSTLRWTGEASGPLTLLFFKHQFSGEVAIHWNGHKNTLNLNAPEVAFQGVTLPLAEPVVWQAKLPLQAFSTERIGFQPRPDPVGNVDLIIKEVKITGIPGQTLALTGEQLLEVVRPKYADAILTSEGVQFIRHSPNLTPKFALNLPLVDNVGWNTAIPWVENLLMILYLGTIGGLVFGVMTWLLSANVLTNINITIVTIIVTLLIGELILQLYLPPDKYYVWPPNLHKIFKPAPEVFSGMEGESHLIVNSEGIRGAEFSSADDYKILTIGGSTTESLYLDQTETWPQLLQDNLNDNSNNLQVWVGNVGRSGHSTREHVLQMEYLLPQYPDLDAVIILVGINDLSIMLDGREAQDLNYLTNTGNRLSRMGRAFAVLPRRNPNLPFYAQSAAWHLLDTIRQSQSQTQVVTDINTEDGLGLNYVERRARRKNAKSFRDELPDLTPGLDEYTRNLNYIIDLAETYDIRLIFMTQPSMWRPDLSQAEIDSLWLGYGYDHEFFYSVQALAEGMAIYNQKLLEICKNRQIECLDLTTDIPKNAAIFYDDVHFNEGGSIQVAKVVTTYLLQHAPFK